MAPVATLRHNSTSNASLDTYTSASFSPTANALLLVVAGVGATGGDPGGVTITDSFTGTGSWSSVQLTSTNWRIVIAWAQLGSSPGSGTVTLDAVRLATNRWALHVYDVTGHDTTTPVTQSNTDATLTTGSYSISLPSAPASDSMVFGGLFLRAESDGSVTAGSGFTAQNNFDGTGAGGALLNSEYDATSPPQSASWSNIAVSITELAAAVIEIAADAGGGGVELVVQDATHSHSADNVALTQHNALTVDDAAHAHSADNLTLGVSVALTVNDATHAHAAESVALTQHYVLVVADSDHAHTVDSVALTQHHALAVADALHGHSADNVTLEIAGQLGVQDAAHGHVADNVTLTQHHVLAVQDASHAHSAEAVTLVVQLVVADALHGHSADNVTLAVGTALVIQDATHAHSVDSVALTQHHALTVADALHAHSADNLVFGGGVAYIVMAVVAMRLVATANVETRFVAQQEVEL